MPQTRSYNHPEDPSHNPRVSSLQEQISDLNSKLANVLTPASLPTFLTTLREQMSTNIQQQITAALAARPTTNVLGQHP
jgi:N-acetylglucosamine-6-phosphate deacetylase